MSAVIHITLSFFFLVLLFLLLLPLLLTLLLYVLFLLLIVFTHKDQSVQSKHTAYHSANVDCKHHIIVFGCKATNEVLAVEIW